MTRRKFGMRLGLAAASFLLLPGMFCSKANDLIQSLRGILNAVEHALNLLSALQGLLPDTVNAVTQYLTKVVQFVDAVGQILESETAQTVDKVRQILVLAGELVVPVVPGQPGVILAAVAAAVNKFLSYFGTDQEHAGVQGRGVPGNVPNMEFDHKQKEELEAIEEQARKDKFLVEDWQRKALGKPR